MRFPLVLVPVLLFGCSAPKLSWQGSPPADVTVRGRAEADIKVDTTAELEWRVTPATNWVSVQSERGSAHLVATPPPGTSGAHALGLQARKGSNSWSEPLTWNLTVVPRQLEPVVKVLGDDGCNYGSGDGATDQSFTNSRSFTIDFGRTFNVDDITAAEIRVDTDGLNNSDQECKDGYTAFCPDFFRVDGTSAQWGPSVGLTHCDRIDSGEARGFQADQTADRPVLQKIASNSLRVIVAPSTGDDCIVNQVVVVVRLIER